MSAVKVCDDAQIQVIPVGILKQVRTRATAGAFGELESLLFWRENFQGELGYGQIAQARKEYAAAMLISEGTFRRKLWQIRDYNPADLERWIESGVSFEHFEIAASLAETAHKSPLQLLNEAIELGDENGKTMTVEQLTAHALGEREPRPETFAALTWIGRLLELPLRLKWDTDKRARFDALVEQIKEFLK